MIPEVSEGLQQQVVDAIFRKQSCVRSFNVQLRIIQFYRSYRFTLVGSQPKVSRLDDALAKRGSACRCRIVPSSFRVSHAEQ